MPAHAAAPAPPAGRALRSLPGLPPVALLVAAALSVQVGAALATTVFARLGVVATAWLRLLGGLVILVAVAAVRRGVRPARARGATLWAVLVGTAFAGMNTAFYGAIDRLPLGVAVAVEFTGPLVVTLVATRRLVHVAWACLAAASVAALTLPRADLGRATGAGVLLALAAGAGWAFYILVGGRLARAWPGGDGLIVALAVASALTTPLGLARGWGRIDARTLGVCLAVGLFATALPYALELVALRRVSTRAFSVMMAMEPAVATGVGLVGLGQVLSPLDLAGVVGVGVSVWGATRSAAG